MLADDGQAAVLAARERRFDVMLMDCQMPGMDGFAATAAIRRNEAERGMPPTPIIALTANVLTRDRDAMPCRRHEWLSRQAIFGGAAHPGTAADRTRRAEPSEPRSPRKQRLSRRPMRQ